MLRGLIGGPPPVATAADLAEFLAAQSAFVAQKCVIEYCRARAGMNWDKLFKEQAFLDAIEECRWEAYAAVLGDMTVLAEGRLRRGAEGQAGELPDRLATLAESALTTFGPATTARGSDWSDVVTEIRARLVEAQLADALPSHEVGKVSGDKVYRILPVHPDIRAYDRELVTNNIRFNLTRAAETMDQRFAPDLARHVLHGR